MAIKTWSLGLKPKDLTKFFTLFYITSTMKKFWTMVWNDSKTSRIFKIALIIHSVDFINVQKQLLCWNETLYIKNFYFLRAFRLSRLLCWNHSHCRLVNPAYWLWDDCKWFQNKQAFFIVCCAQEGF